MKTIHTVSGTIKLIDPMNLDKNRRPRPEMDKVLKFDRAVVIGDTDEELKADFLAKMFRTIDPVFSAHWLKEVKKAQVENRFELVELYSVNTHGKTMQ